MAKRRGPPSPTDSAAMREAAVTMELVRTPATEIARRLGVTRQTVSQWRREPEYRLAVDLPLEERRQMVEEAMRLVLGEVAASYVEAVFLWLQEPRSPAAILEQLEAAAKWAGVTPPPVADAGEQGAAALLHDLMKSAAERVAARRQG